MELILTILVTGFSSSILFDWALPLLSESGNSDVGTQFWSLIALREGLVAMDLENIKRWAAALFEMCERLLDAEDTSPSLLQPLLAVVVQVAVEASMPAYYNSLNSFACCSICI